MDQQNIEHENIIDEENFRHFIRKFSSLEIIESVYKKSKEIYFDSCSFDSLCHHVKIIDENGQILEENIIIQPWQFADLVYKSVLYSNDYRGSICLNDYNFLCVLVKTSEYISSITNNLIKELHSTFDYSLFLYGFSGEQFKYESQYTIFQNLIRELYIILTVVKKYPSDINPEEIIREEIDVEWKDLILVLFDIFLYSLFNQDVNKAIEHLILDSGKNKDEIFKKVTDYYSVDYDTIKKNNPLKRQIFYVKPYIKTQKKGLLTISVYFNQFIIEHSVFWIIRNYFLKKQSQTFTNEFGRLFEHYLEELFAFYKIKFQKVPEGKEKRADWHLTIGHYEILIEQKSAVLPISIKQQLTDFKIYRKEVHKTIYKALEQLDKTEKDLHVNMPIKIILCYDNYIDANLLPHVFEENDCPTVDDGRYFIFNITEIEMFIELASTNYGLFENVIKDMLRKNTIDKKEGISMLQIMRDNGHNRDSYLNSHIFDEYKNLFKNIIYNNELFKNKLKDLF